MKCTLLKNKKLPKFMKIIKVIKSYFIKISLNLPKIVIILIIKLKQILMPFNNSHQAHL